MKALHSGTGSMRRVVALVSVLLLTSLRLGETTQVHARLAASASRPTREMVVASPSVRLAPIALRALSPRGRVPVLVPWSPFEGESGFALAGRNERIVVAQQQRTSLRGGPAHRLTYDATAPPRLS